MTTFHENVWAETAVAETIYPPLPESTRADVAVIGAGYCGLSAALHLAEAGAQVVVIEAHQPGWGASGRNGGQVIPGFKYDPDELEAMFGRERGERIWRFGAGTADCVFDLIARHRMEVTTRRAGWVQGIHSEKASIRGRQRAAQWQRRGADVAYLDATATAEILGTALYRGSVIDRRGGALQPLSYARELARVASGFGARIFGETSRGRPGAGRIRLAGSLSQRRVDRCGSRARLHQCLFRTAGAGAGAFDHRGKLAAGRDRAASR